MMNRAAWALCGALLLPSGIAAAEPSDAAQVRKVIEDNVHSVLGMLRDKKLSPPERKKKIFERVETVFDMPLMAKLTLGRDHWAKFSPEQRQRFSDLFINNVYDTYYDKIELFSDETVEFEAPVAADGGKYQMGTRVVSKGEKYALLYKLYKSGSDWKVYDFEIEGISLVRTYNGQYDQFLQKASPDELIAKLKERSLKAPDELEKAGKRDKK